MLDQLSNAREDVRSLKRDRDMWSPASSGLLPYIVVTIDVVTLATCCHVNLTSLSAAVPPLCLLLLIVFLSPICSTVNETVREWILDDNIQPLHAFPVIDSSGVGEPSSRVHHRLLCCPPLMFCRGRDGPLATSRHVSVIHL